MIRYLVFREDKPKPSKLKTLAEKVNALRKPETTFQFIQSFDNHGGATAFVAEQKKKFATTRYLICSKKVAE